MKEYIGDLFDYEDEGAILVIPITIAFKHCGDLIMNKGYQRKAAKWYPGLPSKLGRWHREHSREPYFASMENILSFPIKMSTKELANATFIELSLKKLKTHLENGLFNNTVFIPTNDPVYEDVDVLSMVREMFINFKNVVIVREIQL